MFSAWVFFFALLCLLCFLYVASVALICLALMSLLRCFHLCLCLCLCLSGRCLTLWFRDGDGVSQWIRAAPGAVKGKAGVRAVGQEVRARGPHHHTSPTKQRFSY